MFAIRHSPCCVVVTLLGFQNVVCFDERSSTRIYILLITTTAGYSIAVLGNLEFLISWWRPTEPGRRGACMEPAAAGIWAAPPMTWCIHAWPLPIPVMGNNKCILPAYVYVHSTLTSMYSTCILALFIPCVTWCRCWTVAHLGSQAPLSTRGHENSSTLCLRHET